MVLICVAVELERAAVAAELARLPAESWRLIRTGVGASAAQRATQTAVAEGGGAITAVIAAGLAGGLDPRWPTAAVLAAEWNATQEDRARRPTDGTLLSAAAELGLPTAGLVTVPTMLAEPAEKAEARRWSGAEFVDMESAAVAEVAAQTGLPFLAVRAVSDTAEQALPRELPALLDEVGRLSWRRLAGALLRRPRLAWELPAVGADARRAAAELARKLATLVERILAKK